MAASFLFRWIKRVVYISLFLIVFALITMGLLMWFSFALLAAKIFFVVQSVEPTPFRVVSFNVFQKGYHVKNGLEKIAKHIRLLDADVVGLQEIDAAHTDVVLKHLGTGWVQCEGSTRNSDRDVTLLTKWKIVQYLTPSNGFSNLGCRISIGSGQNKALVDFWNVHLNYLAYGPHRACFGSKGGMINDLNYSEYNSPGYGTISRVDEIKRLLSNSAVVSPFKQTPSVIMGDFNVPSHLDWTPRAKHLHCGVSYTWPVSKLLEQNGFVDSYRQVYPDPVTTPANTWSPVKDKSDIYARYAEPQDRIDYVYYKNGLSKGVTVRSSQIYYGSSVPSKYPNLYWNDWPSDHAAVVTDFR